MKNSGKLLVLLGFSLVLLLQAACTGNPNPVESLPWVPRDLASAAEQLNSKCPEMVDPESRLDSVLLLTEGLSFFYTLPNKEKSGISGQAFRAYLMPGIIDNIRTNPRMAMFRDSSVTMIFNYRDRSGGLITEFSVEAKHYR